MQADAVAKLKFEAEGYWFDWQEMIYKNDQDNGRKKPSQDILP